MLPTPAGSSVDRHDAPQSCVVPGTQSVVVVAGLVEPFRELGKLAGVVIGKRPGEIDKVPVEVFGVVKPPRFAIAVFVCGGQPMGCASAFFARWAAGIPTH